MSSRSAAPRAPPRPRRPAPAGHRRRRGERRRRPAPTDTLRLTLDEAIQRALARSEDMRTARACVKQTQGQVLQAMSRGAAAGLGHDHSTTGSSRASSQGMAADTGIFGAILKNSSFAAQHTWTVDLTAQQLLWSSGKVGAALRTARAANQAARANERETASDLTFQVRQAYYDAVYSQRLVEIAESALEQARAHLAPGARRAPRGRPLRVRAAARRGGRGQPGTRRGRGQERLRASPCSNLKRLVDVPLEQPLLLLTPLVAGGRHGAGGHRPFDRGGPAAGGGRGEPRGRGAPPGGEAVPRPVLARPLRLDRRCRTWRIRRIPGRCAASSGATGTPTCGSTCPSSTDSGRTARWSRRAPSTRGRTAGRDGCAEGRGHRGGAGPRRDRALADHAAGPARDRAPGAARLGAGGRALHERHVHAGRGLGRPAAAPVVRGQRGPGHARLPGRHRRSSSARWAIRCRSSAGRSTDVTPSSNPEGTR